MSATLTGGSIRIYECFMLYWLWFFLYILGIVWLLNFIFFNSCDIRNWFQSQKFCISYRMLSPNITEWSQSLLVALLYGFKLWLHAYRRPDKLSKKSFWELNDSYYAKILVLLVIWDVCCFRTTLRSRDKVPCLLWQLLTLYWLTCEFGMLSITIFRFLFC
jgi:hypothetical protein